MQLHTSHQQSHHSQPLLLTLVLLGAAAALPHGPAQIRVWVPVLFVQHVVGS